MCLYTRTLCNNTFLLWDSFQFSYQKKGKKTKRGKKALYNILVKQQSGNDKQNHSHTGIVAHCNSEWYAFEGGYMHEMVPNTLLWYKIRIRRILLQFGFSPYLLSETSFRSFWEEEEIEGSFWGEITVQKVIMCQLLSLYPKIKLCKCEEMMLSTKLTAVGVE